MKATTISTVLPPATLPESHWVAAWQARGASVWAIAKVVMLELIRRKDFYVLFFLTALITILLGSVNFFNEDKIVRYLKEICLLLIWISSLVIAVTTTARQIPAERESRTIFPLLAKPVSRAQLVLGKFLGCWLATGLCLVVFYSFFGVISGLREHTWPLASYGQAFLLHWFMLGVVVAMTLLGSIVFAAPSSNSTIILVATLSILVLARHLNKVALQLGEPGQTLVYGIYYLLPHLELFDMRDLIIHNWGTVPWLVGLGAVLYATAYTALFVTLTCLAFRRKSIL